MMYEINKSLTESDDFCVCLLACPSLGLKPLNLGPLSCLQLGGLSTLVSSILIGIGEEIFEVKPEYSSDTIPIMPRVPETKSQGKNTFDVNFKLY